MLALFRRITYAYLWRYRRAEAVSDRIQTNESSVLCADGGGTPAHAQDVPAARSLSVMDDGDRDCALEGGQDLAAPRPLVFYG